MHGRSKEQCFVTGYSNNGPLPTSSGADSSRLTAQSGVRAPRGRSSDLKDFEETRAQIRLLSSQLLSFKFDLQRIHSRFPALFRAESGEALNELIFANALAAVEHAETLDGERLRKKRLVKKRSRRVRDRSRETPPFNGVRSRQRAAFASPLLSPHTRRRRKRIRQTLKFLASSEESSEAPNASSSSHRGVSGAALYGRATSAGVDERFNLLQRRRSRTDRASGHGFARVTSKSSLQRASARRQPIAEFLRRQKKKPSKEAYRRYFASSSESDDSAEPVAKKCKESCEDSGAVSALDNKPIKPAAAAAVCSQNVSKGTKVASGEHVTRVEAPQVDKSASGNKSTASEPAEVAVRHRVAHKPAVTFEKRRAYSESFASATKARTSSYNKTTARSLSRLVVDQSNKPIIDLVNSTAPALAASSEYFFIDEPITTLANGVVNYYFTYF